MIRAASVTDLETLLSLELRCFLTDRISRRQFRHLLTKAHAHTLIAAGEGDEGPLGYVLLLFRSGTSMARLYSIAVAPEARGRGLARQLVLAAEEAARSWDCATLRLEIREDNAASIALFTGLGYEQFGEYDEYYEDHADALRFEKSLAPEHGTATGRIPYYQQTLDFTCGPAALLMAMRALDDQVVLDRKAELRLWREATTIFMTSGHGGCGPHGLALAAAHRGFAVEVYTRGVGTFLGDSVRSDEKKEVMRLVQEDMEAELARLGVPLHEGALSLATVEAHHEAGAIALVLISSYRLYGERLPHWVVVTGFDEHFVYTHDPFVDVELGETPVDSIDVPILRREFERMARYGRAGVRAVVLVRRA